ncbi:hypothetical protein SAMN04487771_106411, partial [[Clostridium] aminophilum]
ASVRSPRVPTRSFTLIPVPSTVGVPCSFWTLACLAASSTLHSLFGIPVRQASALPRASFRPTPHGGALASGCILPTAGRIRDFHPLERAPAGRTKKVARLRIHRTRATFGWYIQFRRKQIPTGLCPPQGCIPVSRKTYSSDFPTVLSADNPICTERCCGKCTDRLPHEHLTIIAGLRSCPLHRYRSTHSDCR